MPSANPGQRSSRTKLIVLSSVLVVAAITVSAFIFLPTTVIVNERTVLYEPDYLIKGIPPEYADREGDFFVSGMTCSQSSDTCSVYSQTPLFDYAYPVNTSFLIVRTKPSLHVKVFINSPKARAAEQSRENTGPSTFNDNF
ncbi:MAG: hypothetical protein K8I00_01205 [Candidatus Omnitrophica bacterium]|nr:hypothetical protein [Candidatus Omnitrophota bacterium]